MHCACLVAQSSLTLCNTLDYSLPGSSVHGIFFSKNAGVGCHFLLQRIFPTQGLRSASLALQAESLTLNHWGSPKINALIFIRKSLLNIHWKDWCWSWNFKTLNTWCKELTHWKRPWWWERLKAGGEGDNRGWDGWMASMTQWTWSE